MVTEDVINKILEYIKKQGQTNTFKLASELGIDRSRILNIIKKLEENGAVEVRSGIVRFLKFPRKEKRVIRKKPIKAKKAPFKPKKKIKRKARATKKPGVLETIETENKGLKEKLSELQKAPPKIIRRTKVKKIIKKVYVKPKKLKEQAEYIKELEEKVRELKKKAGKPKIIRRTIVKEVPKIVRKTIIKKVPVKVKEKTPKKEPRKFKLPKIKFSGFNKNIKRLNVPEILKKS